MVSRVAGIVLASGTSTRFGASNKLVAPVGGIPIIQRTVRAYVDAGLDPLIVVVGHGATEIEQLLRDLPLHCVHNAEFESGQSRALVHGLGALPHAVQAAVIGVGDQPFLRSGVIRALVDRYELRRPLLVAPRYAGQAGNPILFDHRLFQELLAVQGDQGGRSVVQRHSNAIEWVPVDDDRAGRDVDTLADLAEANRELS
jgi:molybdenum cofactor cytidylyltransferase